MANIANRSPWLVTCPGLPDSKIRLKSKAQAYLDGLKNPSAKMVQLETAFEVQIKLKDKLGNVVQDSKTCSTKAEAEAWAKKREDEILAYKKTNGHFDIGYETISLEEALNKLMEEHYKGKSSYEENSYRVPHIVQFFGKKKLLKDVTTRDCLDYRKYLETEKYSASSIRNYFVVINVLFKHAVSEWLYAIPNPAAGIKLPKVSNAVQRYWKEEEERKLVLEAVKKYRPNILDAVELALLVSFRKGELVPKTLLEKHDGTGLMWEGVNFKNNTITLFQEKNDHKKRNTEYKGRTVPMPKRAREILLRRYEESPTKKGRVFEFSGNTLYHAFKWCCRKIGIEDLNVHSLRKIATVDLGHKVQNVLQLSKMTGHKSLQVLNDRYYNPSIEELQSLLVEIDTNNPILKCILILEKHVGKTNAQEFLKFVREAPINEPIDESEDLYEQLKLISDSLEEAEAEEI
ncbi:site-specific integrase [Herbaspirillum sp. ST 5-3]|uniref:tyrosine-type recombinase/integrase n=1 Tax=Oxalobacteraceae TaxID=75682 RepID=UPI0010A3DD68|nr:site-specific integrase [Herbaspirillum sp. ST 5-3]